MGRSGNPIEWTHEFRLQRSIVVAYSALGSLLARNARILVQELGTSKLVIRVSERHPRWVTHHSKATTRWKTPGRGGQSTYWESEDGE